MLLGFFLAHSGSGLAASQSGPACAMEDTQSLEVRASVPRKEMNAFSMWVHFPPGLAFEEAVAKDDLLETRSRNLAGEGCQTKGRVPRLHRPSQHPCQG